MNGRQRNLATKKSKAIKKINQKKIQYENYEISRGISLKIINVRVEKAKIDIHGNYIYKIDNESHNEVGVELDFAGSSEIKSRDISHSDDSFVFKKQIEPFAQKRNNLLPSSTLQQADNNSIVVHNTASEDKIDINSGKICEIEYLIGYKVNARIKVEVNFPSIEKQKNLIQADEDFIQENLKLCENYLKSIAYEKLTLEDVSSILSQFNIKSFVDCEFSPNSIKEIQVKMDNKLDTLIKDEEDGNNEEDTRTIAVHWRKLDLLIPEDKKVIFSKEDINPLDIIYGLKKNANIICVLAHLAEFPCLIDRLFTQKSINEIGMYKVRLYKRGAWEDFYIDQYIPCFPQSFPVYSFSTDSGWVVLLEKALAKLFGGYERLSSLPFSKVYKALTGIPVVNIHLESEQDKKVNEFFDKLEEASSKRYIITAYADKEHLKRHSEKYENYFFPDYSYPIIAAVTTGIYKMIVLRNIWKGSNFSGEYYLNSSKLPQNVLDYFEKYQEKTVIIMSPKEFVKFFNNVCVINTNNYFEKSLRGKFFRCQDSLESDLENILSYNYFEVTANEETQLKICLSLSEEEFFADKYISDKMDLSIGILNVDESKGKWNIHFQQDFILDKQVIADVTLPRGKYIVIPRTMGYCMKKHKSAYNQYFSAFSLDGKHLNTEVLSKIFEETFYLYDQDCSGDLSFKELEKIINRLNGQLDDDEYKKIVKKYCQYSDTITLKGFVNLLKDIFVLKKDSQILEFLRNLGFDKNLFPYLHRFYSIHFYSSKNIKIQSKFNVNDNFDRIFCNCLLEGVAANEKGKTSEISQVTYKSQNGFYYIEGVRNNSKKDSKEIEVDASKCQKFYHSTFCSKYSKFVNPSSVEFFMYLTVDNTNECQTTEKKAIDINVIRNFKNLK